jgi:hypothetical protein
MSVLQALDIGLAFLVFAVAAWTIFAWSVRGHGRLCRLWTAAVARLDTPVCGRRVLIAYRSFDTMLEKVVLVLAVVGVWSLAADRYWGGAPGEPRAARPEPTLAFLAQVLATLGILVGVHIFWSAPFSPRCG